jgi:hypothetical protein
MFGDFLVHGRSHLVCLHAGISCFEISTFIYKELFWTAVFIFLRHMYTFLLRKFVIRVPTSPEKHEFPRTV